MSARTVLLNTDALGAFTYERPMFAQVLAIEAVVGDMTNPDIDVIDAVSGATIKSWAGLSADDYWQPGSAPVIFGTVRVEVANGGDTKSGRLRFLLET